jgi:predicted Zn-dependent protease
MAKETLRNALKTIPEDFDLLLKYANISYKNSHLEDGIEYLNRALLLKPDHQEANDLLYKFQQRAGRKEMLLEKV